MYLPHPIVHSIYLLLILIHDDILIVLFDGKFYIKIIVIHGFYHWIASFCAIGFHHFCYGISKNYCQSFRFCHVA